MFNAVWSFEGLQHNSLMSSAYTNTLISSTATNPLMKSSMKSEQIELGTEPWWTPQVTWLMKILILEVVVKIEEHFKKGTKILKISREK